MYFRKEWQWDRTQTGGSSVIVDADHLVWYYENWAAPFTDMGAEQTLDDFLIQGGRSSIPPEMLAEVEATVHDHPPPETWANAHHEFQGVATLWSFSNRSVTL